ncbi:MULTISPECIES: thioredoxin family protein [unclassified Staphylococcus]|uniref:thioredoxin family protein n=1 Tax=unclassified Staphylococcus TaxID=91994 RepID=UPI0021D3A4FE|nr:MULTISPECIES: thioredoxin family protein [unclassified Staphylococcus]UXR70039.1 thioredoxin family protein [Staphylococcus sp. IVB6246]UXR72097.1 thioredoxin family protein [Staphylococcus sp. IVB6240]UXR74405.1 thioredoxin family protein [Staphylococcus sp. IVB6238]UXR76790.1 thioredoxin family protein [Staphylococcus sp. IVB6233]UXR80918.1 thioredoxin family protein [Staphylococcus sp. IVB6218]
MTQNHTQDEVLTEHFDEEVHLIFGYTSMCGTCKVSEHMLDIANKILALPLTKVNLNFYPEFNQENKIMSVPVLLIMKKDQEVERLYAFQSVPFLLEKIKKVIDES